MSLLLDQAYWTTQVGNLEHCRPRKGKVMNAEQTAEYLDTLCRVFSDLSRDPYIVEDLQGAFLVMGSGLNYPPVGTPSFRAFVEAYERAEEEWLMRCGINMDAAADIIESVRGTYLTSFDFSEGPERIAGRIATAQRVCCREAGKQVEEAEKETRSQEMRGVFSGLVKVAIDISPPAGAVIAGMPWLAAALSPIASFSVRSGLQAVIDGTKRWF